ncbi:hypothetical protein OROGR_022213 [Orobanche gracilis]
MKINQLDKGKEKTVFNSFKRVKLNAKREYVDKKSEVIASRIVDEDVNVEDINKIFLEVNPPNDNSFIYGFWSLGIAFSALDTSFSQGSRSRMLEDRLRKEFTKRDVEYLKLQMKQMLLSADVERQG